MELPILSNFREGLVAWRSSTHGARKAYDRYGLLKTADSGYHFLVAWVDVAQDVIREDDCEIDRGLLIRAITDGKKLRKHSEERLQGRYTKKSVKNLATTGEVIVGPDTFDY